MKKKKIRKSLILWLSRISIYLLKDIALISENIFSGKPERETQRWFIEIQSIVLKAHNKNHKNSNLVENLAFLKIKPRHPSV